MHEVSDVATDPHSQRHPGRHGSTVVNGTRDGIDIEVIIKHDQIWTAYPTNVVRNP